MDTPSSSSVSLSVVSSLMSSPSCSTGVLPDGSSVSSDVHGKVGGNKASVVLESFCRCSDGGTDLTCSAEVPMCDRNCSSEESLGCVLVYCCRAAVTGGDALPSVAIFKGGDGLGTGLGIGLGTGLDIELESESASISTTLMN